MKVYRLEKWGFGPFMGSIHSGLHVVKRKGFKRGDNPNDFLYVSESRQLLKAYFDLLASQTPVFECFDDYINDGYVVKEYEVPRRLVRKLDTYESVVHMSCIPGYPDNAARLQENIAKEHARLLAEPVFSLSGHV